MLCFRYDLFLLDGYFIASHSPPSGWTHIVLNYIGPNNGQGIRIFVDGAEVRSDTDKVLPINPYSAGDGRIVVGRRFTGTDEKYARVQIDELIYFNQALKESEIASLYNLE